MLKHFISGEFRVESLELTPLFTLHFPLFTIFAGGKI
jgi:hypothetical protein